MVRPLRPDLEVASNKLIALRNLGGVFADLGAAAGNYVSNLKETGNYKAAEYQALVTYMAASLEWVLNEARDVALVRVEIVEYLDKVIADYSEEGAKNPVDQQRFEDQILTVLRNLLTNYVNKSDFSSVESLTELYIDALAYINVGISDKKGFDSYRTTHLTTPQAIMRTFEQWQLIEVAKSKTESETK